MKGQIVMCTALRLVALVGVILFSYSISISSQSAIPIPGKIEVENYTNFYDLTTGNAGGACRTDNVDLYVTWDPPDGGCNLGHTQATEWLSFTINVSQANTYVLSARVAHPGVGGTFHVEVNGVDVTGAMTVPDTIDWGEWRTIRKHGIALTAGQHQLKLVMDSVSPTTFSVGVFNYLALTRSAPFGGTPRAVPGKIEMEDFDINADGGVGELAAYHDVTPANVGDATHRFPEAVDIATTADVGGGFQVGWTEDGEWLAYSVYIYTHGGYRLSMRVAHPGLGGTFHMEVDGVPVTGPIQIPDTGGFSNWQTISATTGYLPQGPHVIYLVLDTTSSVTGAVANVNWIDLSPDQTIGLSTGTSSTSAAITNNGWPRFMLGFSYFGALNPEHTEPTIQTVKDIFIQAANPRNPAPPPEGMPPVQPGFGPEFDVVRIFPNWWAESPTAVNCSNIPENHQNYNPKTLFTTATLGTPSNGINEQTWAKLLQVIDEGRKVGLFIQLSMAIEPARGMTWAGYKTAMRELAKRLSDLGPAAQHVFIEPQNEFTRQIPELCKPFFKPALDPNNPNDDNDPNVAELIEIVKNPTANPPCSDPPVAPCDAFRFTTLTFGGDPLFAEHVRAVTGVDFIAWEEPRTLEWDDAGHTYKEVKRVRDATLNQIVINLGETLSYDEAVTSAGLDPDSQWTKEDWWQAAREAKRAGAGIWVWHTRGLFLYSDSGFHNGQLHPTEWLVLEHLRREVDNLDGPPPRIPDRCWGRGFPVPDWPPPPCP